MATEIVVPALGESVTEATVSKWLKSAGDAVAIDEPLVELETDKITLEVPAAAAGVLGAIEVAEGRTVEVGAVLGSIEPGDGNSASAPSPPARPKASPPAASPSLSPAVRRLVDEVRTAGRGRTAAAKGNLPHPCPCFRRTAYYRYRCLVFPVDSDVHIQLREAP